MKYLLDTNICIYLMKKKPVSVIQRFRTIPPMEVGISTITIAELEFGVEKSQKAKENREALQRFLLPLIIIPFELADTKSYGQIRQHLQSLGKPIGAMDLQIAAQARQREITLVTNNTREFSHIPKLQLENWVK